MSGRCGSCEKKWARRASQTRERLASDALFTTVDDERFDAREKDLTVVVKSFVPSPMVPGTARGKTIHLFCWLILQMAFQIKSTHDRGTRSCENTRNKSFRMISDWFIYFWTFLDRGNQYILKHVSKVFQIFNPIPSRHASRIRGSVQKYGRFPFFATFVFKFNFEIQFSVVFRLVFPFIPLFLSTLYLSEPFKPCFIKPFENQTKIKQI